MKKLIFTLLLSAFLLNNSLAKKTRLVDRIVAVVNEEIVMLSELKQAMKTYSNQKNNLPKAKTYQLRVLEKLIHDKLKSSLLKKNRAQVTEEILDSAVEQIAAKNNLSVETLSQQLPKQHLTMADLRRNIRDEIETTRLRQAFLGNKIILNKIALKKELSKIPRSVVLGNSPQYYLVSHILIEDENLAKTVAQSAKSGADFAALAKKHSQTPTAQYGGNLGWRLLKDFPEVIAKNIKGMRSRQVKGPVFSGDSWHIIKLMKLEGGVVRRNFSADERKQQASQALLQKKTNQYMTKILSRLRKQAYVEIKL